MAKHAKGPKRYGTRYGKTIRRKLGEVEAMQKKLYECPECKQEKVKRLAAGIWQCRKCGIKFAGNAFSVSKKIKIKEEVIDVNKEVITKRKRLKKKEKDEDVEEEQEEPKMETIEEDIEEDESNSEEDEEERQED